MAACLNCGKKTETDYLIWKGGASRALCEACQAEHENKNTSRKYEQKKPFVPSIF